MFSTLTLDVGSLLVLLWFLFPVPHPGDDAEDALLQDELTIVQMGVADSEPIPEELDAAPYVPEEVPLSPVASKLQVVVGAMDAFENGSDSESAAQVETILRSIIDLPATLRYRTAVRLLLDARKKTREAILSYEVGSGLNSRDSIELNERYCDWWEEGSFGYFR